MFGAHGQITCTTAVLFFGCSIGTALSPNLAAFFIFRILTAFEGTAFLLVGSACLQYVSRILNAPHFAFPVFFLLLYFFD